MITTVTSYAIPPLRCETCDGTGRVDGTEEYLEQLLRGGPDVYMSGEPHLKQCYVCSGTGRHVSRARAGLAAPPTIYFDIEAGGLLPIDEVAYAQQKAMLDEAMAQMRIVDDVQEDTPESREKARTWFDGPALTPPGAHVNVFQTTFRPGPYPDPLWDVSHAPKWWREAAPRDVETVEKDGKTIQFFFNGREHLLKDPE